MTEKCYTLRTGYVLLGVFTGFNFKTIRIQKAGAGDQRAS